MKAIFNLLNKLLSQENYKLEIKEKFIRLSNANIIVGALISINQFYSKIIKVNNKLNHQSNFDIY